ncbi:MAG TPA: type III-A CRISPR-associated RAMP protein Csm4 [Roseiflexaceae bacterium]
MASLQFYRLRPAGAFHFGVQGIGVEESAERCPSDTLYAALLIEAARAGRPFFAPSSGHDDDQPLDPPLLLSSCFPYVGEVPLLPYPRLRLPVSDDAIAQHPKLGKKLKYVSPAIFRLILAQQSGALDDYLPTSGAGKGRLAMGGAVWAAAEDGELPEAPFWKVDTMPHVTVDRARHASQYYEVGQVYFRAGCGLYVICRERAPGAASGLGELLQRLGDGGLGGRRSRGLGQFSVEGPQDLDLPEAGGAARLALLSRYRPGRAELAAGVLGEGAAYDLVRVGGWLQTPDVEQAAQRRRNVRLLSEGSVVRMLPGGQTPVGTICDVRPVYDAATFPHPVWRYGLALGVGIGA